MQWRIKTISLLLVFCTYVQGSYSVCIERGGSKTVLELVDGKGASIILTKKKEFLYRKLKEGDPILTLSELMEFV